MSHLELQDSGRTPAGGSTRVEVEVRKTQGSGVRQEEGGGWGEEEKKQDCVLFQSNKSWLDIEEKGGSKHHEERSSSG